MFPLTSGLFTWRWGPQVGEVTCGGLPHLSCKRDHIKMRDYMDRQVIPPKRVTSPIWGTLPPRTDRPEVKGNIRTLRKTKLTVSLGI